MKIRMMRYPDNQFVDIPKPAERICLYATAERKEYFGQVNQDGVTASVHCRRKVIPNADLRSNYWRLVSPIQSVA